MLSVVVQSSVFKKFCLYPKWQSSMRRCRKSGNHPQEDSAKSGYEVQNFNDPSISLATHSKTNIKIWRFSLCFPHLLRIGNLQNHFNIKFPIHKFGKILPIKKRLVWRDDFKNVVIFTWSHILRNVHQVLLWINCECIFGECNGTFPILSVASLKFEHALRT